MCISIQAECLNKANINKKIITRFPNFSETSIYIYGRIDLNMCTTLVNNKFLYIDFLIFMILKCIRPAQNSIRFNFSLVRPVFRTTS